jgi:hypothetical protein
MASYLLTNRGIAGDLPNQTFRQLLLLLHCGIFAIADNPIYRIYLHLSPGIIGQILNLMTNINQFYRILLSYIKECQERKYFPIFHKWEPFDFSLCFLPDIKME